MVLDGGLFLDGQESRWSRCRDIRCIDCVMNFMCLCELFTRIFTKRGQPSH